MRANTKAAIAFDYTLPATLKLTLPVMREALTKVRDELLTHGINGGPRKLNMEVVCNRKDDGLGSSCGMAACIGGWASIFLLGFEKFPDHATDGNDVDELFDAMLNLERAAYGDNGRLSNLFHGFYATEDHNEPNVAATAINRYLHGKAKPWPAGYMPDVLPYTTKRALAAKRK